MKESKKIYTAEELIRLYRLDKLNSDRKSTAVIKEGLQKTETLLNNFVQATTKNLKELQDQVDGNITTWFFVGVPTLNNQPAIEWTSELSKANHLGDLYYDKDTGYCYRFTIENDEYKWLKITDNDVTEALAIANAAQDTADSKRRIFVAQPSPPYEVGDMWIKDDKDIYRCRAERQDGTFNNADWVIATDYTNDDYAKGVEAVLNQFKKEVSLTYITKVIFETTVNSILASVSTQAEKVEYIQTITTPIKTTNSKYIADGYNTSIPKGVIYGKSEQDNEPTITNPSEIKSIRPYMNLFDGEIEDGSYNTGTGLKVVFANRWRSKNFIKINPNSEYIISNDGIAVGMNVLFYKSNKTFISHIYILANKTFITPNNAEYITIYSDLNSNTIQIEEGTIVHPYIPYGKWYLPIVDMGKNKYKETQNIDVNGSSEKYIQCNVSQSNIYTISLTKSRINGVTITQNQVWGIRRVDYYNNDTLISQETGAIVGLASGSTRVSKTITTPANCNKIRIRIDNNNGDSNINTRVSDIQVELSQQSTPYEPYQEAISYVDMSKENLFDYNDTSNRYTNLFVNQAGTQIGVASNNTTIVIPCKENTVYTIKSEITRTRFRVNSYSSIPTSTISVNGASNDNGNIILYKTNASAKYLFLNLDSFDNLDKITIYEGFYPYYELSSINDTKDELEVVSGELTNRVGTIVLDGVNNKFTGKHASIKTDTQGFFQFTLPNKIVGTTSGSTEYAQCNYLKYIEGGASSAINSTGLWWEGNSLINYASLPFTTTADANNWLQTQYNNGTPVIIEYVLATPTTTTTIPPTNVSLLDGVNNIEVVNYYNLIPDTLIDYYVLNVLNKAYTTKEENRAQFEILNNSIKIDINKTLEDYSKTEEMNASIIAKINENNSSYVAIEVNKKLNSADYTKAQIIAKINDNTSQALISADAIDLKANDIFNIISNNQINLTGKNISISSTNYSVDKDGVMTAKRGYIGNGLNGWNIGDTAIYNGCNSINSTIVGTYVGVNGFRNYASSTSNTTITGGKITSNNVDLTGKITANDGNIGGWKIISSGIEKDGTNYKVGVYDGESGNYLFVYNKTNNTYPFWIHSDGQMYASNATIEGTITANSGAIGGAVISNIGLLKQDGDTGWGLLSTREHANICLYAGANTTNIGGAPFRVYHDGSFYATNAHIEGEITATSGSFTGSLYSTNGKIGGWTIKNGYLTATSGGYSVSLSPDKITVTKGTSVWQANWASIANAAHNYPVS